MPQIFILIDKSEINSENINSFYARREMMQYQADKLNAELKNTVWILQPNY